MTSNPPPVEQWDPFFRDVQLKLVDRLGLQNVVISVGRHRGSNGKVEVSLFNQVSSSDASERDPTIQCPADPKIAANELPKEIQAILDTLLAGCSVNFGDIYFFVNRGWLRKTMFTVSARPDESSYPFFIVNI